MAVSALPALELRHAMLARPGVAELGGEPALSCTVAAGQVTLLTGGSSTVREAAFKLLGMLVPPAGGEVLVAGQPTAGWSDAERAAHRADHFGYVFTGPFLLPSLTALENVAMPVLKRTQVPAESMREHLQGLFALVGMAGTEQRPAGELPFAQQFRIALARALAHEPRLLLVEELDRSLAGDDLEGIANLLYTLCATQGLTVVITAAGMSAAPWAHAVWWWQAGELVPTLHARAPLS